MPTSSLPDAGVRVVPTRIETPQMRFKKLFYKELYVEALYFRGLDGIPLNGAPPCCTLLCVCWLVTEGTPLHQVDGASVPDQVCAVIR